MFGSMNIRRSGRTNYWVMRRSMYVLSFPIDQNGELIHSLDLAPYRSRRRHSSWGYRGTSQWLWITAFEIGVRRFRQSFNVAIINIFRGTQHRVEDAVPPFSQSVQYQQEERRWGWWLEIESQTFLLFIVINWGTNLRTEPKKIGMLLKALGGQFCCQLSNIYAKFRLHYHFLPWKLGLDFWLLPTSTFYNKCVQIM